MSWLWLLVIILGLIAWSLAGLMFATLIFFLEWGSHRNQGEIGWVMTFVCGPIVWYGLFASWLERRRKNKP